MDCLYGMDLMTKQDIKIDAVITDPPYGTTQNRWDSIIPLNIMWDKLKNIRNDDTPIMLFGQTPFDKILGSSNIKELRYELIWKKSKSTGYLNARRMPMKSHENILMFYKRLPVYNPQMTKGKPYKNYHTPGDTGSNYGENKKEYSYENKGTRFPISILEFDSVKSNVQIHPTQKPVELIEYLIKTYTNKGDTVLDFTIGSGTTAIACINTGRNYIGFELDKKYYQIATNRINEAIQKTQTL